MLFVKWYRIQGHLLNVWDCLSVFLPQLEYLLIISFDAFSHHIIVKINPLRKTSLFPLYYL